jgi:transposase
VEKFTCTVLRGGGDGNITPLTRPWKKRFTYGTILVDLERRKILDVLADRESATVEGWLQEHPEVELVIRDRGKDFTKAATMGAPQAQQVVDRFHMVRNLSEVLQEILGHCRAEIRQGEAPLSQVEKAAAEPTHPLPTAATWQQRTPAQVKQVHQARQAGRDDRYTQMTTLRMQGVTQREVAKRMGMSERTVRHWLKRGAAPTNERQVRRRSVFDPYAAYVLQRWQDGIHEAKQLYAEIRAQGFPGTVRIVQRGCRRHCATTQRSFPLLQPPELIASPQRRQPGCSSGILRN